MKWYPGFSVTVLLLAGCASGAPNGVDSNPEQVCTEPRPEVCTMEYKPVCARLEDGSQQTYSNGCGACADERVVAWRERACGE
jgi:hypothetical protein